MKFNKGFGLVVPSEVDPTESDVGAEEDRRTPDVMTTDWNLWKTGLMAIDGSMQL